MTQFNSIDEVKAYYGEENLVKIVNLRQIVFYCKSIQPVWVEEGYNDKIVCWFEKAATRFVWEKWKESAPNRSVDK